MFDDSIWDEMNNMRKQMDNMFRKMSHFGPENETRIDRDKDNSNSGFSDFRGAWVDTRETQTEYIIAIEIPEMKKEDIDLNLSGNFLEIKAQKNREEKREDKDKGIYGFSKSYSGFYKAVDLPLNADTSKIKAEFKSGVLKVKIPKKVSPKPRHKIDIN